MNIYVLRSGASNAGDWGTPWFYCEQNGMCGRLKQTRLEAAIDGWRRFGVELGPLA